MTTKTREEIKKEIYETRKAQAKVGYGMRKQNATKYGQYERILDRLYRELDNTK